MTTSSPRPARVPRPGWLPGLDGLRALAVAAVVAFHLFPDQVRGGFLGVDLFFAISGFLITRLLLLEVARTGRIAVGRFWWRRWRRLVPAVLALVAVLSVAGATAWRDQLPFLRGGALASIGYVTNWWLIFAHHDYFVTTGRPPMIQHLWSLAIEEQFYLLWPLVLAGALGVGLRLRRTRSGPAGPGRIAPDALMRVVLLCVAFAGLSALAMAVLAIRADVPFGADGSRVYYGSDTHATGLLLGAALGALSLAGYGRTARPWRSRTRRGLGRAATDLLGLLALAFVVDRLVRADQFDPNLYRSGFATFALGATVLVACVARPGSWLARPLDLRVLRWIGARSYSIYLWYWPVIVVTRPGLDVSGPLWLLHVNQLAVIVALGALSYRFIEQPFRVGGFGWRPAWAAASAGSRSGSAGSAPPRRRTPGYRARHRLRPILAVALSGALLAGVVGMSQGHPVDRAGGNTAPTTGPTSLAYTAPPVPGPAWPTDDVPPPRSSPTASPSRSVPATPHTSKAAAPPKAVIPGTVSVSAFGDSVMLGAAPALISALPQASVFAVEGRQARDVFADIAKRHAKLGRVVVIHTGDNGVISRSDLLATLNSLRQAERVVLITVRVPRDWEKPNNRLLTSVAGKFGNVVLLDWHTLSAAHPGWFYNDGIHLRPAGARSYATLVRTAVEDGRV